MVEINGRGLIKFAVSDSKLNMQQRFRRSEQRFKGYATKRKVLVMAPPTGAMARLNVAKSYGFANAFYGRWTIIQ